MTTRRAMPRQADIAREAGVSQATVSVVLSGNRARVRMAETTRLRVLEAAEKLGYVPDPVATRLASSRNHMLGLYTFKTTFPTDVADSYYPILVGVEEEAAALGQDLILFTGRGGADRRDHDAAAIRRTRVADGCLFFGRHVPDEAIGGLLDSGFPLVYIGRRPELDNRIPFVGADYVRASAKVVEQLIHHGHRNIRYLREPDDAPSSTDRERGFRQATAGLPATVHRLDGGIDLDAWRKEGVTAVVVEETDTSTAYTAVTNALEAGNLTCPRDLSLAVLGRPPGQAEHVTGFAVPRREMGRQAVRLLVRLITRELGQDSPAARQLLPCEPVAGTTVGPVNQGSPA
ncbi:LacI family DNA-binding transcriptional regulator [Amycolatopsis magusensis]|uniref:DNA-binding LacI/PurR family transcriptional regulator n=1 Tax=Amycolatopsis magusensis TaxID=882444 RepID=A0ABS4PML3_9PSEU|nr:LacI family DNA-binding transcriptional regulator [Amycolatopsis magusensis]MBP2180625.1 DNA-binding LacI/PurR family transcriptional regulator [Amycolatopsis magusensis]